MYLSPLQKILYGIVYQLNARLANRYQIAKCKFHQHYFHRIQVMWADVGLDVSCS